MKNKIIIIEGTDCSGKQTQSDLLVKKLTEKNISIYKTSFPQYDTPTGRIIGECCLGKNIGHSFFPEESANVDPKVMGLYYAADRLYNISKINEALKTSTVILDRYVDSNLAHQGGKVKDEKERIKTYEFFEELEYNLLKLPKPDIKILLYLPHEYSYILRQNRVNEALDEVERNEEYLSNGERAYLEVAKRHDYKIINCVKDEKIRTIEEINEELFNFVYSELKKED